MKKKIVKIGIAAMIVSAVAVNVYLNNSNKNEAGDVAQSEFAALAQSESEAQYELSEVVVTCSGTGAGQCYKRNCVLKTAPCEYSGRPVDYCCNCN